MTESNGLFDKIANAIHSIALYTVLACVKGAAYLPVSLVTRGPFLESPSHLTGPKSYFEIKVSRKLKCVLTSNEVHFVYLADNFTI